MALLPVISFRRPIPPSSANPQRTFWRCDHVSNTDRLERSGVGEFIGRSAADTENGCDVIHGVCSALGRPFFVGCVGAHKIILHLC